MGFRIIGILLGILFMIVGGYLLMFPIFYGLIEKLNSISMILAGTMFIYYGLTKNNLFKEILRIVNEIRR